MRIRVIYDPYLRQTVAPVTVFDAALKTEAETMLKLMKQHNGIGLAANQVGLNKQLIVMEYEPKNPSDEDELPRIPRLILCNPRVIKFSQEKATAVEGCLSLPGLELSVTRSVGVTVAAQDLTGQSIQIKAKGLLARVLQHEIDHLHGVLFTDHVKGYKSVDHYQWAKIVFLGSDDFSETVLRSLLTTGWPILAAICETDKRSGRGQTKNISPIKTLAQEQAVAVFQPETTNELTDIVRQLKPDLLILASYGKILPAETLATPTYGSLNVHPSLLPKYRGATPVQTAILDGATETGVSLMTMAPAVDAGGVIAKRPHSLSGHETSPQLKQTLAQLGARLLIDQLPTYLCGQAKITIQEEARVTKTVKLTKEMGEIDWTKPIDQIEREIRAFQPWPGSFTWLGTQRLKILQASVNKDKLNLEVVQLEGKQPTNWPDFARGHAQQLTKSPWSAKIS